MASAQTSNGSAVDLGKLEHRWGARTFENLAIVPSSGQASELMSPNHWRQEIPFVSCGSPERAPGFAG